MLNINFNNFKKNHQNKINQIIYYSTKTNGLNEISNLRDENSKKDQENIKTDQVKIVCENYWTFDNEFQNILKSYRLFPFRLKVSPPHKKKLCTCTASAQLKHSSMWNKLNLCRTEGQKYRKNRKFLISLRM